jgi:hypothetical protein
MRSKDELVAQQLTNQQGEYIRVWCALSVIHVILRREIGEGIRLVV